MTKEFDRPDIKLVRFKDGIDVICRCYKVEQGTYDLNEPMMFDVSSKGQLVLQHWLPLGVMKQRFVRIKETDILCIYEPNQNFAEYYYNTMERLNSVVESSDEDPDIGDIMDALDELESSKGISIH